MLIKKNCDKPIHINIDTSKPFDKQRIFMKCKSYEFAKDNNFDFSRNRVLFTEDGYVVFQGHVYKYVCEV